MSHAISVLEAALRHKSAELGIGTNRFYEYQKAVEFQRIHMERCTRERDQLAATIALLKSAAEIVTG